MQQHHLLLLSPINRRLSHVEASLGELNTRLLERQSNMVVFMASMAGIQKAVELLTQERGKTNTANIQEQNLNSQCVHEHITNQRREQE